MSKRGPLGDLTQGFATTPLLSDCDRGKQYPTTSVLVHVPGEALCRRSVRSRLARRQRPRLVTFERRGHASQPAIRSPTRKPLWQYSVTY